MSLPKTTEAWIIQGTDPKKGFGNLVLKKDVPVPFL